MISTSNFHRKSFNGREKHRNKKSSTTNKGNKHLKSLTGMMKKKLENLAAKRNLENIKVLPEENSYSCSIFNEDGICLFKTVLKANSYLSTWDMLYGDKWFDSKGKNGSDLDEAINYFESRRREIVRRRKRLKT